MSPISTQPALGDGSFSGRQKPFIQQRSESLGNRIEQLEAARFQANQALPRRRFCQLGNLVVG